MTKLGTGAGTPAWSKLGRLAAAAALSTAFGAAHAEGVQDQASNGAIADGLSTAAGLAAGAVELNPLGPVLAMGMKVVTLHYVKTLPDVERPAAYATAASVWQGFAANNVCVTAALLSGGSFAPACLAVGVAWAVKTWRESEHERQFWEGCAMLRQYAEQPDLKCVYTPPATEVAALDDVEVAENARDMMAP